MNKNNEQIDLTDALDAYEESCLHLRGFAVLLDRDIEIDGETRDEVSALLSHLMRGHVSSTKNLISAIQTLHKTLSL